MNCGSPASASNVIPRLDSPICEIVETESTYYRLTMIYDSSDLNSVDDVRKDALKFYTLDDSAIATEIGDSVDNEKYCFGLKPLTSEDVAWSSTETTNTGISFNSDGPTLVNNQFSCGRYENKCSDGARDCWAWISFISCDNGYTPVDYIEPCS